MYLCSSALTASSVISALAGPRDRLGHPDTAYHKTASQSLKHGLADAIKYILEWAAAISTVIPHLYVQCLQSLADAIEYNRERAASVCTAVPHLSVQFVLQSLIYLYSLYCLMIISQCPLCCLGGTVLTSLTLLYLNNKS